MTNQGTTATLAEWAAAFRLEQAPDLVVERMKALVLDMVARLDRDARPKQMLARFVTAPGWVDGGGTPGADWLGDCCTVR